MGGVKFMSEKKEEGLKFDNKKPPMELLPFSSLEEVAKVLEAGAIKYKERGNWAKGLQISRLISASIRHIGQYNEGEDYDKETNTLHLANAACNLLFAIWMHNNRPDMDDRWIKNVRKNNKGDDNG
jgi:hypothetical protein